MGSQSAGGQRPFLAHRLTDEAGLRRRIELADRHGIPPSRFDGREPAEITTHEYDGAGRLVRSVTVREPLYTDQDRAELEALAMYRDRLCPRCGRPIEVCTAPEGRVDFEVTWQVCQASLALLERQRATYDGKQHPNRDAHLWGTTIRKS